MDYEVIMHFLRFNVLISETMLALSVMSFVLCVVVAMRTKIWGLLIAAGGTLPVVIYYAMSSMHLWSSGSEGHVYGRLAYAVLFISLAICYRRIYIRSKGIYYE